MRSGTGAEADLFYDDLVPGRSFDLGVTTVAEAEMVAYARRYDPQWYHIGDDPVASGFFTVSLFMRAYVDHVLSRAAAAMSPGLEELRWLAPVRGGDTLAIRLDVLDRRPSTAKPGLGTVTLAGTMTRVPSGPDVLRTRFRGWFSVRPDSG